MDHSKILIQRATRPFITSAAVCFVFPSSVKSFLNSPWFTSCQVPKQMSKYIWFLWELGALLNSSEEQPHNGTPFTSFPSFRFFLTLAFWCCCLQGPGAGSRVQCAETGRTVFGNSGFRLSHPVRVPRHRRHQAAIAGQYSAIRGHQCSKFILQFLSD